MRSYYRKYEKKYRLENGFKYEKDWKLRNPEKVKAHKKLSYAVKVGRIKKQPCRECGGGNVQGHHPNYSEPLKVIWLCPEHHTEHHQELLTLK